MRHGHTIQEMTSGEAILAFALGLILIVIGFVNKQFYSGAGYSQGKPVPRWMGRALFVSIGALFIATAIYHLILTW